MLLDNGLDQRLAYHIGTLFRRSPIPVYEKELMFPDCCSELIQSEERKESPKNVSEIEEEEKKQAEKTEDPASALFGLKK